MPCTSTFVLMTAMPNLYTCACFTLQHYASAILSALSPFSIIGGGRGILRRRIVDLRKYGTVWVSSYFRNCFVGTEKTSMIYVSWMLHAMIKGSLTVQFFQCQLLSFSNEAEDHEPGYEVESSVETEGSSWRHDRLHSRKRQTEDTSYEEYISRCSVDWVLEGLPKVLLMHTAQAIPCSRWMVGNTSAEY